MRLRADTWLAEMENALVWAVVDELRKEEMFHFGWRI